jgi:hypothetical protein
MSNNKLDFYTIYSTFIKNLEFDFFFLEYKFFSYHESCSKKVISNILSFKVFLKYKRFLTELLIDLNIRENQKNNGNNWFIWLSKLIRKKNELFYFRFEINPRFPIISQTYFNRKIHIYKKILNYNMCKFLKFNQNNHFTSWKTITFLFECAICQKIIRKVRSTEIFNLSNLFHKNIFLFRFFTKPATSNRVKCIRCNNTTRIRKKVLIDSDSNFILENFISFKEEFKKNYLSYMGDEILIKEFDSNFKTFPLKKIDFSANLLIKKKMFVFGNHENFLFFKYFRSFKKILQEREKFYKKKEFYLISTNLRLKIEKIEQIEKMYLENRSEKISKIIKF